MPGFLFTRAQLVTVSNNFTGAAYLTIGGSMQHFATYKEVPGAVISISISVTAKAAGSFMAAIRFLKVR